MSETDRDEFWDIDKLLPKKSARRAAKFDTTSVGISSAPMPPETSNPALFSSSELKLSACSAAKEKETARLVLEYSPENAFIGKVSVYTAPSPYRYYEDFELTMHKYLRLTVKEAERVPFFSYVPQYSQLSKQRLSWYLYWRSLCRRREYVQTDLSYIILYIYELLNFENPRHPDRIIAELCSLWRAYRAEYHQLDRYLPDWVCDYCLIHAVSLPTDIVSDFIYDTTEHSTLKGFYYGAENVGSDAYTWGMICAASLYNYKKSKYYTDENKALFDTHIKAAVSFALGEKLGGGSEGERSYVRHKRDVYVGALCTAAAKRTLYIEHIPLTQARLLRSETTLAIKHAENRLRGILGIKSRLSTVGLDLKLKEKTDRYFAEAFGAEISSEHRRTQETEPDYMAYYDSQTHGTELCRAADIEAASWDTAQLMCESFDEDDELLFAEQDSAQKEDKKEKSDISKEASKSSAEAVPLLDFEAYENEEGSCELCLDFCEREVLSLLLLGKSKEAERTAAEHGRFLSAVCERINEAALDILSDIVTEQRDGEYYVLSDYESEVKQWLK